MVAALVTVPAGIQTAATDVIPVPPQAMAVGYNTRTFGPDVTLGKNWQLFNQLAVTPNAGQAVQNADGSVTLSPNNIADGSGYGANICTTQKVGSTWTGTAFGGGFYIEGVMRFPPNVGNPGVLPFPAFWAEDINFLQAHTLQWPGQAVGYICRVEVDFMQWAHNLATTYSGLSILHWYGLPGSQVFNINNPTATNTTGSFSCTAVSGTLTVGAFVTLLAPLGGTGSIAGYVNPTAYKISATNGSTTFTLQTVGGGTVTTTPGTITGGAWQVNIVSQPSNPPGANVKLSQNAGSFGVPATGMPPIVFSNYNRYGALWIPATATTQGTMIQYLNGQAVGFATGSPPNAVQCVWNQYNPASPPPPLFSDQAGAVLDVSNMSIILGADITCPMDVASVTVWQSGTSGNLTQ